MISSVVPVLMKKLKKALFLDRDGVINHDIHYAFLPEQVVFMDGIFEITRLARIMGYLIVVVTNQAGIGRGYYTDEQFHALMQWMNNKFMENGSGLDAVYYCPYHPINGVGKYLADSDCRKPKPGMFFCAAEELRIDLGRSIMVGDKSSDLLAAGRAGVGLSFCYGECIGAANFHKINSLMEILPYLSSENNT